MSSEPFYISLLRIAIVLGCWLLVFVVMGLIGFVIDAPIHAVVDNIAAEFGELGLVAFIVSIFAGGIVFTRWAWRRHDRQQIAETGVLDYRRPNVVREGLGRNIAILLGPIAVLVAIGFLFWLTGTPLPPTYPR